jgi:DDE superfamily endonuclease
MAWDAEDLNRQRVQLMLTTATLGDGVLLLDDTGFAKQGKASVGVTRQYSGTLGQVGNCQVAVTCCYSDPWATWPVGVRLYRFCCKKPTSLAKEYVNFGLGVLGSQAEQAVDELDLGLDSTCWNLPLPDHMHRLVAPQGSPGR